MKILVCIKQVICSETPLAVRPDGKWLEEDGHAEFRMNRFDDYALEEALRIKETHPDVSIDVLSVGPERVKDVIKKGLSKGAGKGIHIFSPEQGYLPPQSVSRMIADWAVPQAYDLIFTGVMAEDDMQCQVGPMTAALLGLPCAVSVIKEELDPEHRCMTVHCEMENGKVEVAEIVLPAVLTIQTGINQPRYPSLSNIMRANVQELTVVDDSIPDDKLDTTELLSLAYPEKSSKIKLLEGTAVEKAEQLLDIFYNKSFLK